MGQLIAQLLSHEGDLSDHLDRSVLWFRLGEAGTIQRS